MTYREEGQKIHPIFDAFYQASGAQQGTRQGLWWLTACIMSGATRLKRHPHSYNEFSKLHLTNTFFFLSMNYELLWITTRLFLITNNDKSALSVAAGCPRHLYSKINKWLEYCDLNSKPKHSWRFFTRLLESLVSRVCKIIKDSERQCKVKSTSHIKKNKLAF